MGFYQAQHHRLIELDSSIRSGKYPNCTTFARKWECSRRTVQRDITYLRYSLGAPIEYDRDRRGYYYTDPSWTLTEMKLTEAELFLLLVAVRMAEQFRGTPLAQNLDSIFQKIRSILTDEVTVDPSYFTTQLVSFHGHPTREISQKVWVKMLKGLRTKRVIRIAYAKPDGKDAEERYVEPLHLACIDGEWYLIAYCRKRKDIRHFAVSRTESVKQTKKAFKPREFDAKEYFKNRFGRYIGIPSQRHHVLIHFSKDAAKWILERTWQPNQKIKKHKDGSLSLSFPAPALYEVKRWILQWGQEAEALEPKELRQSIAEDVQKLAKRYKKRVK